MGVKNQLRDVIGYMVIYITAICQFIEILHKIINWYINIIQVENKNVGLKMCVCVGGGINIPSPPPPPPFPK